MRVVVASSSIPANAVTYSEWGFGGFSGTSIVPYSLEVDRADLVQRLATTYVESIAELKRDDQIVRHFHPPWAHPVFGGTIGDLQANRMQVIGTYLQFDILGAYLDEELNDRSVRRWIRTLDSVSAQGSQILIRRRVEPRQ